MGGRPVRRGTARIPKSPVSRRRNNARLSTALLLIGADTVAANLAETTTRFCVTGSETSNILFVKVASEEIYWRSVALRKARTATSQY